MKAYIGIGSNLGNRQWYIEQALQVINPQRTSSIYESLPVAMKSTSLFYNLVIEIETDMEPNRLLDYLEAVEMRLGRSNKGERRPRTIDLDLLLYNNQEIDMPGLKVPHPEIANRLFVLEPLAELIPDCIVAKYNKTIKELLDGCQKEKATVSC